MNSKKFRLILIGIFALSVIGFAGTCFLGLSLLKSKSAQMVDLKLKNKTAEAQLSNLEISKQDIEKYSYFKEVAKTVIPDDKDQAQAVLEIFQMAQASGIGIQSITFPSSNLGAKTVAPSATAGSTAPAAVDSAPTKAISQAAPVSGIPGLYSVQLTISPLSGSQLPPSQQVTYAKMLDFLSRIENNRRTAQITQVNIQPGNGQQLNFSLTVNIFIKS
jgi:ABC-type transport system involved in multi-copper enzyme maturation permease subunit